jgi:hypothetical protein
MKKWWQLRRTEGQSLVELALILPLLLLMFAGLVEVGAALRNYLVVVNANREGTRFAARGRWFDSVDEVQEIFGRVVAAAGIEQRGDQFVQILRPLPVGDLGPNTTIAIHYIQVPDQIDRVGGLAVEPAVINGPWYTGTVHLGRSEVNAPAVAEAAREANYEFNQKYFIQDRLLDIPSEDNFVIVEVWFEHEQLLKLPFFTELLPETFTLYAQSTMRVTLDSRIE